MLPAGGSARRRADLLALLVYGGLACLLFLPALHAPASRIIGYPGDAQQTMWFLRWTPWALTHGTDPLVTGYLNHPTGVNLMWNSLAPALGIALWPVSATAGLVVSYNVLVAAEIALSAWCAHLALRRFVARPLAAGIGGLLYGFSPFLLAHAHGHAKIIFALLPPLLLIVLHEMLVVQRRRPRTSGIALGALIILQLLVYEEGVVLAVIAGAAATAVLAILHRDRVRAAGPHALRAVAWAGATIVLLGAYPLGVQLLGPNRITSTVPGGSVYVSDLANLALPTDYQLVAPAPATRVTAGLSGNEAENGAYLGLPLLGILALSVLWLRGRPVARWALISAAVLGLLSLGPQLHVGGHVSRPPLPWRAVEALPVVGAALPVRLVVYVDLLVALLLALVVAEALGTRRPAAQRALAGGLLALTVVTLLPRVPFPSTAVGVPAFFRGDGVDSLAAGSVALVAPFAHDGPSDPAMLWQAESEMRFRMPEGYFVGVRGNGMRSDGPHLSATGSAMIAIQSGHAAPALTPRLRTQVMDELCRWEVRTVLVGPMAHEQRMTTFVSALLGRSPQRVGGVLVWRLPQG